MLLWCHDLLIYFPFFKDLSIWQRERVLTCAHRCVSWARGRGREFSSRISTEHGLIGVDPTIQRSQPEQKTKSWTLNWPSHSGASVMLWFIIRNMYLVFHPVSGTELLKLLEFLKAMKVSFVMLMRWLLDLLKVWAGCQEIQPLD